MGIAAVIDIEDNSQNKNTNYILKNSKQEYFTLDKKTLKGLMKSKELLVVNMELTGNNRLVKKHLKRTYDYPQDSKELNLFELDDVKITAIKYGEIKNQKYDGVIKEFRIWLKTKMQDYICINFGRTVFTKGVGNCYYGIHFRAEIINRLIKDYVEKNIEGQDEIKRLLKILASDESVEALDTKIDVEEIKLSLELHNCNVNINGKKTSLIKGTIDLPSAKKPSECCRIVNTFIHKLGIINYMSGDDLRNIQHNGDMEKTINWLIDKRCINRKYCVVKSNNYSVSTQDSCFRIMCEIKEKEHK